MGIYYYLLNDTKRERVHLDYHVKEGAMTMNHAVHFALCNYMAQNMGDTLRLCGDSGDDGEDYAEIDLLRYGFCFPDVLQEVVRLLNDAYGCQKYAIVDGVGVELGAEEEAAIPSARA